MPLEVTTDDDGFELQLLRGKDGRFVANNFNLDTIENMASIKLKEDDIIFYSYAKSGMDRISIPNTCKLIYIYI